MAVRERLMGTPIGRSARAIRAWTNLYRWKWFTRPAEPPPALYKQRVVRQYARRFKTTVLVETGTYLGDMVFAQLRHFKSIYSIELGKDLAAQAQARFAPCPHVTILEGDSGDLLTRLIPKIEGPCLFWLDGHYSEGVTARGSLVTPVRRELHAIIDARRVRDVVLIDDARLFTGRDDYPRIEDLLRWVHRERPDWATEVRDDLVRLHPGAPCGGLPTKLGTGANPRPGHRSEGRTR